MWWFVWIVLAAVGLAQLPILVDCLRVFFPHWRISRIAGRITSIILVTFLCSISVVAMSYFFTVFLPLREKDPFNSVKGWLHISFAVWVWFNMVFNYAVAVFASPGTVAPGATPQDSKSLSSGDADSTTTASTLSAPTRPQHACKRCNAIIPYMDHHCPFTGNCVGLGNYTNFVLMLLYGWVGLVYALRMSLPYFYTCRIVKFLWFFKLTSGPLAMDETTLQKCQELGPHTLITLPVFMGTMVVSFLLAWQALMLLVDMSTTAILSSRGLSLRDLFKRVQHKKFANEHSRLRVMFVDRMSAYDLISLVIITSFFIFL